MKNRWNRSLQGHFSVVFFYFHQISFFFFRASIARSLTHFVRSFTHSIFHKSISTQPTKKKRVCVNFKNQPFMRNDAYSWLKLIHMCVARSLRSLTLLFCKPIPKPHLKNARMSHAETSFSHELTHTVFLKWFVCVCENACAVLCMSQKCPVQWNGWKSYSSCYLLLYTCITLAMPC